MVLLESSQLGHNVFIDSYSNNVKELIEEKVVNKFIKMFHHVADLAIEFIRVNCKIPCAGAPAFLVNHMIRII
jgi:hypothetical protein